VSIERPTQLAMHSLNNSLLDRSIVEFQRENYTTDVTHNFSIILASTAVFV